MKMNRDDHKTPRAATAAHPILRVPFNVGDDAQEFTIERVDQTAFVAHFSAHDLHLNAAEGTPRTRDLDLAAWLGFERPRKIRDLIRRMESEGKLRGVEWRPTVGRQSAGRDGSGVREYTVTEAWLTREQALLVAAKSDTPRAWALLGVMVKVFDGVLSMLHAPPANSVSREDIEGILRDAIDRATAPLREEIATMRDRYAPALLGECIGRRAAEEEIAKPVRALATRLHGHDALFTRRQHIGRLHIEMREAISAAPNLRLEDFDAELLRTARGWIRARNRGLDRREDASRGGRRRKVKAAQGSLGFN